MNKITKEYLEEYVSDLGNVETKHRRGATFYATCTHTIDHTDIQEIKTEGVDASDFLNIRVTLTGLYDDDNGCDWYSMEFCKVEEYQELVPEQVIPAHYVTKVKTEEFVPVWQ